MANVVTITLDDKGPFIRRGSSKYRPKSSKEASALKRGMVVRAWPLTSPGKLQIKVQSPVGDQIWELE